MTARSLPARAPSRPADTPRGPIPAAGTSNVTKTKVSRRRAGWKVESRAARPGMRRSNADARHCDEDVTAELCAVTTELHRGPR